MSRVYQFSYDEVLMILRALKVYDNEDEKVEVEDLIREIEDHL